MIAVRDMDDIMSEGSDHIAALLQEAFEAGLAKGRLEATREFKARLSGLLDDVAQAPLISTMQHFNAGAPVESPAVDGFLEQSRRASPGSVRPTIERHLAWSRTDGVTTESVGTKTGIKPNSIRGTLWTLGKEGLAEKREGRWFPTEKLLRHQESVDAAMSLVNEISDSETLNDLPELELESAADLMKARTAVPRSVLE